MNENINLVEILKDCPSGTKLYSPLAGEVELCKVDEEEYFPILIKFNDDCYLCKIGFTGDGRFYNSPDSECLLFPSKEQRDWSKFKAPWLKKPKFDPKTFQPFDRVLARVHDKHNCLWFADFISTPASNDMLTTVIGEYGCDMVIPYNEETKHLVGTTEEAPEYYRYWED